jgi:DNA polymerase III sliding clamp (beta) subunit (PCNA family)
VSVNYGGSPLKVCCNWRHVLDFLDAAAEQFITIAFKDERSPMLFTDGAHHLSVIMDMRM